MKIFLFLSLLVSVSVFAGETSEIVLTDGSKIYGEVLSLNNGVYQLKTESLGVIEIPSSRVRLIRVRSDQIELPKTSSGSGSSLSLESGTVQSDIETLKSSILNNSEVMGMILSLQDDPAIQKILADPAIMEAVNSGDIGAFISNPKILEIMNHPRIQEIQKKLGTGSGTK